MNKLTSSMKRLVLLILFLSVSAVGLAGCAGKESDPAGEAGSGVKVTATIGMIADAATPEEISCCRLTSTLTGNLD